MRPTDYIASLFKPSGGPGGESAAYDFDPIGSYFYNCPAEEGVFQIVDAETTADLDLNAVFEKIDRTTSRVGQQYLYARLRTLRGEEDAADFDRRVGAFENDDELMQRCAGHLARLAGDDAYDLCRLIFDTLVRVRRIGLIYALTAAAAAALLLAPFYPALLLLFVAIYAVNMYIHYSNTGFPFYDILDLRSAGIVHLGIRYYNICCLSGQIHNHIRKSFRFEKQFCRSFFLHKISHIYHTGDCTFFFCLGKGFVVDDR